MRKFFLSILFFSLFITVWSQNVYPNRLKVFIDCQTGCDMTFIRSEINIVDFLLDRVAADIHVLITDQNTGGGGDEYQLIFFGQNQFKNISDTLRFFNEPNNTDFEERVLLLKYLKLGLAPYIARTNMAKEIDIKMRSDKLPDSANNAAIKIKDPWNYWVFRTGINGSIEMDEVYKSYRFNGEFSVNRVTEDIKVGFEISGGKNKNSYIDEDTSGIKKIINRNDNYNVQHYLVKSINDHWSYGYEASFSRSTFSNNKHRALFRTGIEYNIFPYKQVNTKFFTISYVLDIRRNKYIDTTLYEKISETLLGQGVESNLSFNQKWGTIELGLEYHNYFHNWKYFNLGMVTEIDIRITGGLSFNFFAYAELSRDQLYLPRDEADLTTVLTRRRQIASGYNFFTNFGLNYRFGSKLNNFVNPRFD
jgi:hypothetical protein